MGYIKEYLSVFLLTCSTTYLLPVFAQDTEDFEVWDEISESMGLITDMEYQAEEPGEKELLARLGVIGGVAPGYRGSDEYELGYAPNIYLVWKDFLFIKGRKLGVQAFDTEHFYGGAFVRYTGGRSDNNDGLEGMGDISRTFTSGVYLNYRYQGIRLKTEIRHDFFDEGHGTLVLASLGSKIPWSEPLFYVGIESTWASDEYMRTFFSVNNYQAMRSGLSQFDADSGLRDVSINLNSGYEIDKHWSIAGQLRYERLLGDAANSPIVREVGSANNFIVGLGLNYTF